jgi:hypothetical protein
MQVFLLDWLNLRVVKYKPSQVLIHLPRCRKLHALVNPFGDPGLVEPVQAQRARAIIQHCFNDLRLTTANDARAYTPDRPNHGDFIAIFQAMDLFQI